MKYVSTENLHELSKIFSDHSYSLYLVGGAVRDFLLGRENSDYDLTTSALPEEVKKMFRRTIDTGIRHGTVTVLFRGEHYEITTFRTEGDYSDSRHPDSVTFVRSLEEDLKRRDFTINALAVDILTGSIIDLHKGKEDLEAKIIRAIGNPGERFHEDALRMMRACRFSAKLGFTIEENTLSAIKMLHSTITKVSAERIKDELDKLLSSPYAVRGMDYLKETGLMEMILPRNVSYSPSVIAKACEEKLPLCSLYSLLFSSLDGKELSALLRRLKFSNCDSDEIKTICPLLNARYPDPAPLDARLFIKKSTKKLAETVLDTRAVIFTGENEQKFSRLVREELEKNVPVEISELMLTGEDLSDVIPKGPGMGRMLNHLLQYVLENPSLNTREKLLEEARNAVSRGF